MSAPATFLIPIVVDGHCIGHLIGRRLGFEPFDREDRSSAHSKLPKRLPLLVVDAANSEKGAG